MRKFLPALVVLAVILVVILGLFALSPAERRTAMAPGGGLGPPAAPQLKLIFISPHNESIQAEFKRAFEAWHKASYHADCAVEWLDHGGSTEDVRFIKSEFAHSPTGIGVDIFWGGGLEPYIQFAELGFLQPVKLPDPILSKLPASIGGVPTYDPDYRWYGTALSGFGIIYNKKRLAGLRLPEPKTWEDLAAPSFFGEVAAADPRASGTAQTMVEVILQAYGWEKGFGILTRIGGNVRTFSRSAGDIPKLVSLGDVAAGQAIDFYAWTQIQRDGKEKIGYVLPEGLTPLTPDAIAVLKGAPNATAAGRFLEFVMSEEGQKLWVLPKGAPAGPVEQELLRIPVLPEVYKKYAAVTNVMFDPSAVKAEFHYDAAMASVRRDVVKDIYGALFIDLAPELSAAWKGVIARGLKPEEVRALCAPPAGEQEIIKLAKAQWSDPEFRNRTLAEWTNAAREKYESLSK